MSFGKLGFGILILVKIQKWNVKNETMCRWLFASDVNPIFANKDIKKQSCVNLINFLQESKYFLFEFEKN